MQDKFRAAIAGIMFTIPAAMFGQVQSLYITNYQLISISPAGSPTLSQMTFRVDLGNPGTPWGGVTATAGTTNPVVVRIVPGQNTLSFPASPQNSVVTSTNTFSVLANPNVPLDTSKISWTFQVTPEAPIANPGPNQTVPLGGHVTVNGGGSTNPSGVGALTYDWAFVSRPPGSSARLSTNWGVQSGFTIDVSGNYVLSLTVSNGIGSSTADVTISTSETPPVANPGPNQFVNIGALVQLNGTGSTDVDGDSLSYQWTLTSKPANSAAKLSDFTALLPTFTADLPGSYQVQLIVNDGLANSAPAIVTITTNPPTVPTAFAGQNLTVAHNTTITLQGVGVDPQGKPLLYMWTLLAKPAGSTSTFSNPSIPQPTLFLDKPGIFIAQLVVTNGSQTSPPATVTFSTTDTPPVANAGPNQDSALVGRTVFLDGSASTDVDHDPLTFKWTFASRPSGTAALISGAGSMIANFIPDVPGVYVAQLMVVDTYASGTPTTVTITVAAPVLITLTPNPLAVSAPAMLTVNLSAPAGPNGVVITLASSNTTAATVAPTVTDLAGASIANVTVMPGSASGTTTITASAPLMNSGTATVNYSSPATIILPSPFSVGVGQRTTFPVQFSVPAPAPSGVLITLTSSDPSKARFASTLVTIPAGATVPVTQPLINGINLGASTITATATGYPTVVETVNAVETITFYPTTVTLPFFSSVRYTWLMLSAVAPAGGLTINLSSDNSNVAVVPATITVPAGQTEVQLFVSGVGNGTTTIHASQLPFVPDATVSVHVGP
jgi:hypothetical protein